MKRTLCSNLVLAAFVASTLLNASEALTQSRLYGYGEQAGDSRLLPADETSSAEIPLRTPFKYYGASYTSLFVNMNGFISFLTEIPTFLNVQFPLDYPIIAAYYSDVDTTTAGTVWFRETSDPTIVNRLQLELRAYFSEAANFYPTTVFIATWDGVGGYELKSDQVNTYQVILASDGRESFILMLYADGGLQWLRGRGKNPSLADSLPQAGFLSGDGRMNLLRGSGKDQVRNLNQWSNVAEPGVWIYRVGQISQTSNIAGPDLLPAAVEEDSCSVGGLMCHSTASCVDYSSGFCCHCPNNTFGNGINCINSDKPLRVTGQVLGDLNGAVLLESDLHSYVLTAEGRTYSAVSRVNRDQGHDLQLLLPISTGISWLFAKPSEGVPNGFTITGGVMNRTVVMDFPQTGHSASIQQLFTGMDVFENIEVQTIIGGTLPPLPEGAKIEMDAFMEEYTRIGPGRLKSRSSRSYRIQGQELETPFLVETTIEFDECGAIPDDQLITNTKFKVVDSIFIQYDKSERIVRFALTASNGPVTEEDPCVKGREECGANSECLADGDSYRCVCNGGYEQMFDGSVGATVCVDMDECATGRHQCSPNAVCSNSPGTYACHCIDGYHGDGYHCVGLCESAGCHPEATCYKAQGTQVMCSCPPHMTGDGYYCFPQPSAPLPPSDPTQKCGEEECGFNAQCDNNHCVCNEGYVGDGYSCVFAGERGSCNIEENCSPYGSCQLDVFGEYMCECLPGFQGDGYTCFLDTDFNRVDTNFPSEGLLPIVPIESIPDFVLGHGNYSHLPVEFGANPYGRYEGGDHYPVSVDVPYIGIPNSVNVGLDEDNRYPYGGPGDYGSGLDFNEESLRPAIPADPNAYAPFLPPNPPVNYPPPVLQTAIPQHVTQPPFFYTDPQLPQQQTQEPRLTPQKVPLPTYDESQVAEPECALGVCFCPAGYKFDRYSGKCVVQTLDEYIGNAVPSGLGGLESGGGCDVFDQCHHHADCVYDPNIQLHSCQCRPGYEGDGYVCTQIQLNCHVLQNCGQHSQCVEMNAGDYRCICQPGYTGDGYFCQPTRSCLHNPAICNEYASCEADPLNVLGYSCRCRSGYTGDGHTCVAAPQFESRLLLVNQGMSVLRMPIDTDAIGGGYPIMVDQYMNAVGSDVDCFNGRYYWTDVRTRTIRSSNFDGSARSPLVTREAEIGSPEDVAVDWVSRNVYWTDSIKDEITATSIEGGMRRTVISGGLVNPRGIAIHPGRGLLFWSDWNRESPKIESAGLDGSDRHVLVEESVELPNCLVIDYETSTLCWADAGTHKIECIGLTGRDRRTVIKGPAYPFGLTQLGHFFYYSDWEDGRIHIVNKYTGREEPSRPVPLGGSGRLYGITAVQDSCPAVSNACQVNRGGCPDDMLCLPNAFGGRICACPSNPVPSGGAYLGCTDIV